MKEAVRYIDLHYNQKVQIRELADYVGVNRSYLASSFQRTLGCSPRAYLIRVRMEKAREMLAGQICRSAWWLLAVSLCGESRCAIPIQRISDIQQIPKGF